jgi:hypothetical protein
VNNYRYQLGETVTNVETRESGRVVNVTDDEDVTVYEVSVKVPQGDIFGEVVRYWAEEDIRS